MGHAEIENLTPFAFDAVFTTDERGRPICVTVVKASYALQPGGGLALAEPQIPVNQAGSLWGEPGVSSYRYEPEYAFTKPSTDVALVGSAHAPFASATEVSVRLSVGPVAKTVRVSGDRYWIPVFGMISMSPPEPFESVPLIYERAFGGWDRSHPDPDRHRFESRNPVGTGFVSSGGKFKEGIRLPNLEDPRHLVHEYRDTPPPAGFGFTSPEWQPRAVFAGTYDERWTNETMPMLPEDFDRRFFNAASPGLVASGYLRGDEPVRIENASRRGILTFNLPGVSPPECRLRLAGAPDALLNTSLDTVVIDTDEDLLFLIWRNYLVLPNGPHDVVAVQVQAEGIAAPAAVR